MDSKGELNEELEREVKLKIGHAAFLGLLRRRRIKYEAKITTEQIDIIFDFPDRRLFKNDQLLRVRIEGDEVKLAFKGSRSIQDYSKVRIEIEGALCSKKAVKAMNMAGIKVSKHPKTLKEVKELLISKGMREVLKIVKERTKLNLKGWQSWVYLDKVRELGEFVEIEGKDANLLVRTLGLSRFVVRESYAEMLSGHYFRRNT